MNDGDVDGVARRLLAQIPDLPSPEIAFVLGSGLGGFSSHFESAHLVRLDFPSVPPATAIAGHSRQIAIGALQGVTCLVFEGRTHLYEGATRANVTFPVRLAHHMGISHIICTNAAGAISPRLAPGMLMQVVGHIAFPHPGSPDTSDYFRPLTYDNGLGREIGSAAGRAGIELSQGVYAFMTGPSYETPAEINALASLGADAVGMSTVPEIQRASSLGMQFGAISVLTNPAAGRTDLRLSHEEVLNGARRASERLHSLLREILTGRRANG